MYMCMYVYMYNMYMYMSPSPRAGVGSSRLADLASPDQMMPRPLLLLFVVPAACSLQVPALPTALSRLNRCRSPPSMSAIRFEPMRLLFDTLYSLQRKLLDQKECELDVDVEIRQA